MQLEFRTRAAYFMPFSTAFLKLGNALITPCLLNCGCSLELLLYVFKNQLMLTNGWFLRYGFKGESLEAKGE